MANSADIGLAVGATIILATVGYAARKQIAAGIVAIVTPPSSFNPGQQGSGSTGTGTTPGSPTAGSGGPISAQIIADQTQGTPPLTVHFQGNVSGGVEPIQYRWGFGDGGVSEDPNPIYTFNQVGVYTVALSVIDAQGQSFTDFISITTNNTTPPTPPGPTNPITNVSNSVLSGEAPLTVGFSIAVLDPTSTISWDFGDPNAGVDNPNTDNGDLVVNHTYFKAGNYTVTLKVTSSKWGTQTKTFNVIVQANTTPINTNLFVSETSGSAPLDVAFSISLNVVQQSIIWTFGDGTNNTQNVLAVSHTYQKAGTYNGSVTVVDVNGNTVTKTFQVVVSPNPLQVLGASIIFSPGPVISPDGNAETDIPITVEGVASEGLSPFTYAWTFGDGASAVGEQVSHPYTAVGNYTIQLTITDAGGNVAVASKTITVENAPVEVGDVKIIIVANQPISSGGAQFTSLQLQVQNNRQDISIPGYVSVMVFNDSTLAEVGTEIKSAAVNVLPGQKIVIPPILTGTYPPGQSLIVIRFFDFSATAKALAEIDLNA